MKKDQCSLPVRKATVSGHDKPICQRVLPALIASCFACGPVYANPTGGQVVAGQATITSNGNVLTITNTPGSIINWLSFNIGAGQVTQFLQQSSSSSVLNRIIGQNPSQIFGALESNGKVFLINPNGILFEPGSQINVGGLVASSLGISNSDFMSGKYNFTSTTATPGSVVNQGNIVSPNGGNIYLIAPQVQNTGVITSPQGEILLAAGHSVQLVDGADPNLQVVISSAGDEAVNLGQVIAQSGKIGIYGALVTQSGTVNADSATVGPNGKIVFKSSQNTTLGANSVTSAVGTVSGSSGGTIEVLGPDVEIIDNALVNASGQAGGGKVMVGGDFHGTNAAIPDSTTVFVGADAVIKADAIKRGNGGNVVVWSENGTLFNGNISAQGGAEEGNGGYVETSSHDYLAFNGLANLKAPHGEAGTLLLDPYTLTISTGANGVTVTPGGPGNPPSPPPTFTANSTSVLNNTTLESQLGLGSVVINTTGSVTNTAPINWSIGYTLAIEAGTGIFINAPITSPGTLELATTTGDITQSAAGVINIGSLFAKATAGNVILNNPNNVITSDVEGFAGGNIGFQLVDSSTGQLRIAAMNTYSSGFYSGITASAGSIQIQNAGSVYAHNSLTSAGNIGIKAGGSIGFYSAAVKASGTVALRAAGNIYQQPSDPPTFTASNLSAVSTGGFVKLGLYANHITGNVAGSAAGNFAPGAIGFSFGNDTGFNIGTVPAVGNIPAVSGITSGHGAINLYTTTGNLTLGAPVSAAGGYGISITTGTIGAGSILQSGTSTISTTGTLTLQATGGSIGASGAGNSILTDVTTLTITGADNVYLSNAGAGLLNLTEVLATGAVNISTLGPLTTATGFNCAGYSCPINFEGSSFTLISGGNMTIGANYIYQSNNGTGPINLYAGFTETPGSSPVSNLTFSTLTLASTFNAATVDLWANQQADYFGQANAAFSNPAQVHYHPFPSPIDVYVLGSTVVAKNYDGVTTATITGGTLSGIPAEYLSGVTLTQSGTFASANVGNSISVTATDVLNVAPALAGDFVLIEPTGLTGTILSVIPTGLQLNNFPKVSGGIQSYIAGLNLTSGSVQGGNHSGNSGSGYTYTFNTGLSEYDTPNKLYCN